MKILVIGFGSMGKRRLECLIKLGYDDLYVYDTKYKENDDFNTLFKNVEFASGMDSIDLNKIGAMFVCTPPKTKAEYIYTANRLNIPCFCEVDIQAYDGDYIPSNTMIFHPGIKLISDLIRNGTLGNPVAFTHHCGQDIDGWHPWEDDFWGMNKNTAAVRESAVFELSWLSYLFGTPIAVEGLSSTDTKNENNDYAERYDKTEQIIISYIQFSNSKQNVSGTLLVDTISNPAVRKLTIVCKEGMIYWDWEHDYIKYSVNGSPFEIIDYPKSEAKDGYNESIREDMYMNETREVMNHIHNMFPYSQSLEGKVISSVSNIGGNHRWI